ncbi:MAG: hypothetical protein AAF590_11165 [Pseudomonadota bacterium]
MQTQNKDTPHETQGIALEPLTFDSERYLAQADYPELNDDQKREFLETIWSIMVHFVDKGFGMENIQLALAAVADTDIASPPGTAAQSHQSRLTSAFEEGTADNDDIRIEKESA